MVGKGFEGQLGIFSDTQLPGLTKLASGIRQHGAISSVQLHHAGIRAPSELIGGSPVGASDDSTTGARALSRDEVIQLREDFVSAAVRAEKAGFDGVQIHGAHGYILSDFLSPEFNRRTDEYGGPLPENRSRLLWEIIDGIKGQTKETFQLGVRISAEKYGLAFSDQLALAAQLFLSNKVDYLDVSCWDSFKEPEDPAFRGKSLTEWFSQLPRGTTKLGVAGKLYSSRDCRRVLEFGADFPIIGRAALLHFDFPRLVERDDSFQSITLPVPPGYLSQQRLGPKFIAYMTKWANFVAPTTVQQ
jgi:2,4-dienoyl-CoA reductase-like NADH-dependent reductase (Old Yellow Enzyme family)